MMATTYSFVRGHFIDSETVFDMLVTRCPPYIEPTLIIVIVAIHIPPLEIISTFSNGITLTPPFSSGLWVI